MLFITQTLADCLSVCPAASLGFRFWPGAGEGWSTKSFTTLLFAFPMLLFPTFSLSPSWKSLCTFNKSLYCWFIRLVKVHPCIWSPLLTQKSKYICLLLRYNFCICLTLIFMIVTLFLFTTLNKWPRPRYTVLFFLYVRLEIFFCAIATLMYTYQFSFYFTT